MDPRHSVGSYDDYRSEHGRGSFSGRDSGGGGGGGGGGEYSSSAFHDPVQPLHHGLHPWEEPSLDDPISARSHYASTKREYRDSSEEEDESPKRAKSGKSKSTPGKDRDDKPEGQRRAAQACLRCRKQKLRCTGGWPCSRCEKAKQECDFGKAGMNPYAAAQVSGSRDAQEATARLEQLESSVANLLAGLAGGSGSAGGAFPPSNGAAGGSERFGQAHQPYDHQPRARASFGAASASGSTILPPPSAWAPPIPPPSHTRQTELPHFPPITTDETAHVRFTNSPTINLINPPSISPSNVTSSGFSPGSALMKDGEKRERRLGKGEKAEERLAAAEGQGPFDPPFKALVYHPSVWENREQSRRSSPQPSGPASRDEYAHHEPYARRWGHEKDDPINVGLVDLAMAETLFNFFISHCHPFLPIVNIAIEDAFSTIRKSPPLISAMLAIAARFYNKWTARTPSLQQTSLPLHTPSRLANLAESHLAQTLLRKQHALSDVQSILLLAAWGLQSNGKGPEAWIVTGHAARVARRLEVHKVLQRAAETARTTQPGTEEWAKLETFMPQWRTWLCWFCFDGFLSLGFGRPQSTQFETVDEAGFLQIRLNQPIPRPGSTLALSLYGDVYIAGQVQLTQIGRDLINWGELLADPSKLSDDDPRKADLSLAAMFKELNSRLDEWCRLWVWAGSPYTLYLGSSARIARLQAEHMRLCLNSYALKSNPENDETVAASLRKALNAAMSTIQTHYEASQTDLALSFATDYLTITLAQAAVFLIRITKAPEHVQAVVKLEPSVIAHYLKMSVDLLESADLSETRLSVYLAKTIREISKAGGIVIPGLGPAPASAPPTRPGSRAGDRDTTLGDITSLNTNANIAIAPGGGQAGGEQVSPPFDWDTFLQTENQLDLGALLGLPGDDQSMIPGVNHAVFGQSGGFEFGNNAEFEFGWGALGNGASGHVME